MFDKMNASFFMILQIDPTPLRDVLAANLRRLRVARHLSLSQLARATGMSKATLSGIENGRANPTVETLASLAAALRVSVAELLEELPLAEIRILRAAGALPRQGEAPAERVLDGLTQSSDLKLAELSLPARFVYEVGPRAEGSRIHVYVLEGKLIAGPVERITELGPGDYVSFPVDVPHVFEAGRQSFRLLLLSPEPS